MEISSRTAGNPGTPTTTAVRATAWAVAVGCCLAAGTTRTATAREEAVAPTQDRRPNVVVILADDLGYGDLGAQGNTSVPTPRIDSIATAGVRFTDGYVTAPVCSPSRAGLLSGRYQQRFGHEFNPGGPVDPSDEVYHRLGLPTDQVLLPKLMRDAGYATGMVGKWHLGYAPEFLPQARGFDEFFGFLSGAHSYVEAGPRTRSPILRGTAPVDEKEYLTDAFAREAAAFIERHKEQPFFLYVPFNAVHTPLEAVEKYLDRVATIQEKNRRVYAAMTVAMDDGVGRILDALEKTGLETGTLVIFLSDNGGVWRPGATNYADNGPLQAGKLFMHEGGSRIPFMMRWPGVIPAGTVYSRPVSSMDILPTALAVAGGTQPEDRPMDGVNLLPYVRGEREGDPHQFLAWRLGRNHALRKGDWKILRYGPNPTRLFNLAQDIGENRNLAGENPEKLKELEDLYAAWESQTIAPVYKVKQPITFSYEGEQITLEF